MRYPEDQKATTRRRIVDAASRLFRERGLEGAALPAIMKAAGLTVGGFYRHFESKDDLFRAALDEALEQSLASLDRPPRPGSDKPTHGPEWTRRAASVYLHPAHRTAVAEGCPLPVLTAEVARGDEATRRRFQGGLEGMVDALAERMGEEGQPASREEAWAFLSLLVGGLMLSRGVEDEEVAEEILRGCREVGGGIGGE